MSTAFVGGLTSMALDMGGFVDWQVPRGVAPDRDVVRGLYALWMMSSERRRGLVACLSGLAE